MELIQTYYSYSMLHQMMFNDDVMGSLYLRKLQSVNDLRKIFQDGEFKSSTDISFMIIESDVNKMGKIKFANKKTH